MRRKIKMPESTRRRKRREEAELDTLAERKRNRVDAKRRHDDDLLLFDNWLDEDDLFDGRWENE